MAFDLGGPSTEPQDETTLTIEELMEDGWSRELAAAETLGDNNEDKVKEYFKKNKRFINMETLVKIIAIMPESFANVWKEVLKKYNKERIIDKMKDLERALEKLFEQVPDSKKYFDKIKKAPNVKNLTDLKLLIADKLNEGKITKREARIYKNHINNTMRLLGMKN